MYSLKSIKLYFFSILKLFFLSIRNFYFQSNFYNKKLVTFIPQRIFYTPSSYLSASLITGNSDFYKITNSLPEILWETSPKDKQLTYLSAIEKRLGVMDSTALSLCMEHSVPIVVFDLFAKGNIKKIVTGGNVGTLVTDS